MRIILLLGPSSAGKTTLCREMVTSHGWKSFSIDEVCNDFLMHNQNLTAHDIPYLLDKLFDHAFDLVNAQQSVILDLVPLPNMTTQAVLEKFEKHRKIFSSQQSQEEVITFKVLAYCPPKKLSERIQKRNANAESQNNPDDKRVGIFPFSQLSTLVTTKTLPNNSIHEHELDRDDLFEITNKHFVEEDKSPAIFVENPISPISLINVSNEDLYFEVNQNGVVKLELELDSDADLQPVCDKLRIGSKKVIADYQKLSNEFGFFAGQEKASMRIADEDSYDVVLNMAENTPASLGVELLGKLNPVIAVDIRNGV